MDLTYQSGFGNHFETEVTKGLLPKGQNSPQKTKGGLYPEQLTGSAFTTPRHLNFRSWLYRLEPAVKENHYEKISFSSVHTAPDAEFVLDPNQSRFDPLPYPQKPTSFFRSWATIVMNGDCAGQKGSGIHLYAATTNEEGLYFYDADAELMIVPQEGALRLLTELGILEIEPLEIAVVPRGVRFRVDLKDKKSRGYLCENYGSPFRIPDLGPIGANGLANPRDFLYPVAWAEKPGEKSPCQVISKFGGQFWSTTCERSPLNVLAWHGNYAPYKYDLRKFNTIGTVSFDHPDPSIFTVLTSPSEFVGVANLDFVIFPPRWMVAENTFRPPYFHRNVMSEFMGLIEGRYDAKVGGFVPGGSSLHNCMSGHGPDTEAYTQATEKKLSPEYYGETMAFMWESRFPFSLSKDSTIQKLRQSDYADCWKGLKPAVVSTKA